MNLKKAIKILKLEKFKDLEDLRRCFRELAHQYHPDKNPNKDTSDDFRKIVTAYDYCLNNIKSLYDFFDVKLEQDFDEITARTVIENFDDIFEDIFGFSKTNQKLGYVEPQVINLTIKEFMTGVKKKQKVLGYEKCPDCRGIGARRGSMARICTYCFGHGVIKRKSHPMAKQKPCPKCRGRGRTITDKCPRCDGFGRLRQSHIQEFFITVGLKPFETYTIQSFDLVTKTHTDLCIEPRPYHDPVFQIDNYDLVCEYHLDFSKHHKELVLILKTPLENVSLTISKNACESDVIRVPGAGLYFSGTKKERGDLLVTLINKKQSLFKRIFGGIFQDHET